MQEYDELKKEIEEFKTMEEKGKENVDGSAS